MSRILDEVAFVSRPFFRKNEVGSIDWGIIFCGPENGILNRINIKFVQNYLPQPWLEW